MSGKMSNIKATWKKGEEHTDDEVLIKCIDVVLKGWGLYGGTW